MSTGNEGCHCINQTSFLSTLQNRGCITPDNRPGVYLTLGGSCVSYDYGSNACLQHDLLHDPKCLFVNNTSNTNNAIIPPYCFQSWCYVDASTCKRDSEEAVYKSDYFSTHDLFYSYSTCNSTDFFWTQQQELISNQGVVGGLAISAVIPTFQDPHMGKIMPNGTIFYDRVSDGEAYFNDSIPFGGLYIDYINAIVQLSNGDIKNASFTHSSKASIKQHPTSAFTAAVQDVENGLVDLGVGPFWITEQRLKMTTFTVPLVYDKTVLVIPKPGHQKSLNYEIQKVLQPFSYNLWVVLVAVTITAALLSVWFSDREELLSKQRYGKKIKLKQKNQPKKKKRTGAYIRLILDSMLEKGMFFFSAGVDQDSNASLPHKTLMFGFGFFILIAVSAYVANLAAFLTQNGLQTNIATMEEVVDSGVAICGHPALEKEVRIRWPEAKWLFPIDAFVGPNSMFEAYARGECKVLAVGREDTTLNRDVLDKMCEIGLVYTDSLVVENPIAFPVKPQLASALSYWMYIGEKSYGVSLENMKQKYIEENGSPAQCKVELSEFEHEEADDFARVSVGNMFLPILMFVTTAFVAICLQLIHENKRRLGKKSAIGRRSTLDIFEEKKKEEEQSVKLDEDDWLMPRAKEVARRRSLSLDLATDAAKIVRFSVCAGASDLVEEFKENGGDTEIVSRQRSIFRGSIDDLACERADSDEEEDNKFISHRIEELVESGVIEEVLNCFDFFQEMKKLKKNQ